MADLRDINAELKKIQRDMELSGGKREVLFQLFWHTEAKDLLPEVNPYVVVNMCVKKDKYIDLQNAEHEAHKIISGFWKAGITERPKDILKPLDSPIILTDIGKSFVRKNNLPPRPIEHLLRGVKAHVGFSIFASIIGILAAVITIVKVFF